MGYPLTRLIGSTDSHTSLATAEEENFFAWMSAGNHRK
ncbi:DUF3604 domain-containing protein [Mesorhizobium australafricanum]|uniref:DUF3604 domain-containing protein n=1 Tax=Mesorhizobium australafricanum TaxID=3072311 RepID=A0ABU4X496_9HYPH|nr:DUF3604 domain-containing protein [Mesorhizobium sp. VK3E]MDX8441982.1 DUF3604 domain-containing protein [Mesorhizobium sp. VK3E]